MGAAESTPEGGKEEESDDFDIMGWVLSCGGARESKSGLRSGSLDSPRLTNASNSRHAVRIPTPRRPITPVGRKLRLSARKRLKEAAGDFVELLSYLYVGEDSFATDYRLLRDLGITHVCNAAAHLVACPFPKKMKYLKMSLEDKGAEQIAHWFLPFMAFVDDAKKCGGKCLIHHTDTINVASAVALAYYMFDTRATMDDAAKVVKAERGDVGLNSGFLCQLLEHGKRINSKPETARVYVIARHSDIDPALVPQACLLPPHRVPLELTPSALDSRLVFVIHDRSAIYVWVGRNAQDAAKKVKVAETTAFQLTSFENGPRTLYVLVQPGGPTPTSIHKRATADVKSSEYVQFGKLVGDTNVSFWQDVGRSAAMDAVAAMDNTSKSTASDKTLPAVPTNAKSVTPESAPTPPARTTAMKGLSLNAADLSQHAGSAPLSSRREDRLDSGARVLSPHEKGQLMRLTEGGIVEDLGVYDMEDLVPAGAFIFIAPSERDRPFVWVGKEFNKGAANAADVAATRAAGACSVDVKLIRIEREGDESETFWELFDMY